jgi:hypothetical protein
MQGKFAKYVLFFGCGFGNSSGLMGLRAKKMLKILVTGGFGRGRVFGDQAVSD